jgi:hypothetical protein
MVAHWRTKTLTDKWSPLLVIRHRPPDVEDPVDLWACPGPARAQHLFEAQLANPEQ